MKIKLSLWARAYGALVKGAPFLAALALAVFLPHNAHSLPVVGLGFAGAIIDAVLQFANATACSTAAVGVAQIGSNVDLAVARNIGAGRQMYLVITVTTAFTSAGAATVQFLLLSDAQDPIASDGTATQHYASAAIPKAALVAGYQIVVPLPLEAPAYERFLGLAQNVGVAALTAGAVTAELTFDAPSSSSKTYPQSARIV